MAPKRPPPIEDPPSASSSDDGEDEVEAGEGEEDEELEASDEEEGSESEEEEKPVQPSLKNPNGIPNPNKNSVTKPLPSLSDSDDDDGNSEEGKASPGDKQGNSIAGDEEESDTDSDSDSDNEPVKHMIAPRNVKPISSLAMNDVPKSKKPTATTTAANNSVAAKRPLEEVDKNEKKDKRIKKKRVSDLEEEDHDHTEENEKKIGEEKKLFQRVWSKQDEIVILNGLINFKKEGNDISANMAGFYDFIKDLLHVDFKQPQLREKIQRLQKKFQNKANKAKPGEDPVISQPHEHMSYQLSKQIWGEQSGKDDGAEQNHVVTDGKKRKIQVNSNGIASPKKKSSKLATNSPVESEKAKLGKVEPKEEADGNSSGYLYLNASLQSRSHPMVPGPPPELGEYFAKKGWDSIGTLKAEVFDQKWKAVLIAEAKAYLERLNVVRDQTQLMLDALESADNY